MLGPPIYLIQPPTIGWTMITSHVHPATDDDANVHSFDERIQTKGSKGSKTTVIHIRVHKHHRLAHVVVRCSLNRYRCELYESSSIGEANVKEFRYLKTQKESS
jgi:hypothetical protein